MVPCHNLVSNLVYSADGSVVDTTIVNGKVLVRQGKAEGADRVIEEAAKRAYKLIDKYGVKQKA